MDFSTDFFQTILENVKDGVWVSDKNDIIFYANKAMAKITGITVEQIINNNVLKDFPKETTIEFNKSYKAAKKSLKSTWYEVTVKTPDGRDSWQNGWLIPKKDKNGNYDGIITTVRDATQRVESEQVLKESEERYHNLVETASDVIYLMDENGMVINTNVCACEMLGRTKNEILQLSICEIDPSFTTDEFLAFWKDVPYGEQQIFETTHLKKGGTLIPIEISGKKFKIGGI
ncbi:MAG: PAS domain S-box protein [Mariniphaga sp.]|nr:PAS domain S-box protein [Mariniphaga sp.]